MPDTQPAPLAVRSLSAKVAKALGFRRLWRLYSEKTLLEGLAQYLQDVAAEFRPFIEQEHPVVRQRHVARPRHQTTPISPTSEMV